MRQSYRLFPKMVRKWGSLAILAVMPIVIALVPLAPGSPSGRRASADQVGLNPAAAGVDVAELKDQLNSGLKARRPEEFAFILVVVAKVENNQLPLDLVTGTFQWARRKKPYPFPFFERGLRLQAAKIGIEL